MSSKRLKPSAPKFLSEFVYKGSQPDLVRAHKSFVLRKKHLLELEECYGEDVYITTDDKGLVVESGRKMSEEEVEWQEIRMRTESAPKIPSVEDCVAKIHQDVWKKVLVKLAQYFDLNKREPKIEPTPDKDGYLATGECGYVHLSQLKLLDADKNVVDFRVFFRNGAICVMADVNLKH